jgi:hypothetical protein
MRARALTFNVLSICANPGLQNTVAVSSLSCFSTQEDSKAVCGHVASSCDAARTCDSIQKLTTNEYSH